MYMTSEHWGSIGVIRPVGHRVDASAAAPFRDEARDEISDHPETSVWLIDLCRIGFVDSSGVGALVGLLKFAGRERCLELCGLTPTVLRVFKLTRLDSVFRIHASLGDGMGAHGHETDGTVIIGQYS